jgi:uncharacterized protein
VNRLLLAACLVAGLALALLAGPACAQKDAKKDAPKKDAIDGMADKVMKALPESAPAQPKAKHKVLIYSKTDGFRHSSIAIGAKAIEMLGDKTGAFTAMHTEDESIFEPERLKAFDAVFMMNTTGDCLKAKELKMHQDALAKIAEIRKLEADYPAIVEALKVAEAGIQQQAIPAAKAKEELYKKSLEDFVLSGKGLMGVHSATDTYGGWKAYNKMMGGAFNNHPWHQKVPIKNLEPSNPLNAAFGGKDFDITDEIYQFRLDTALPSDRLFLLELDVAKMGNEAAKGNRKTEGPYAVSWASTYGKGRTFYCSLGHREEIYWNPTILQHYLAGLQYVLGDLDAPAKATELPK